MAKRKTKVAEKPVGEQLEDLAMELSKLPLTDEVLNDEIRDAVDMDADLAYEEISHSVLLDKLHFLWCRGWDIARIREIVEEDKRDWHGKE